MATDTMRVTVPLARAQPAPAQPPPGAGQRLRQDPSRCPAADARRRRAPGSDRRPRRRHDGLDLRNTPGAAGACPALEQHAARRCAGLYGDPVNVDTLGGFISWHYSAYFALLAGLWSILALASTLAGEARRGSLDLAVATARSRRPSPWRRWPVTWSPCAIAMALVALATWLSGAVFARLPGDAIDPGAAIAFAAGTRAQGAHRGRHRLRARAVDRARVPRRASPGR